MLFNFSKFFFQLKNKNDNFVSCSSIKWRCYIYYMGIICPKLFFSFKVCSKRRLQGKAYCVFLNNSFRRFESFLKQTFCAKQFCSVFRHLMKQMQVEQTCWGKQVPQAPLFCQHLQHHNSLACWNRELFKPSTDSGITLVQIEKKFVLLWDCFFVGNVTMGDCFRFFGRVYLTLGANPTSHCLAQFFWKLGYNPNLQRVWATS